MALEEIPTGLKQTLGGVDVGVEDDRLGVNPFRARGEILRGLLLCPGQTRGGDGEDGQGKRDAERSVHRCLQDLERRPEFDTPSPVFRSGRRR